MFLFFLLFSILSRLSDKYSSQLENLTLVCHFCGNFLDSETVNSPCFNNTTTTDYSNSNNNNNTNNNNNNVKPVFTDDIIPLELLNTRRHVFGRPSSNFNEKINSIVSNTHQKHRLNDNRVHQEEKRLEEINIIEEEKKRERREKREKEKQMQDNNVRYGVSVINSLNKNNSNINNTNSNTKQKVNNTSNLDLKGIMDKIKQISASQNIDPELLMNDFFKDRKNTTYDELKALLQNKFDLSENECNRFLAQIVSVPPNIGGSMNNSFNINNNNSNSQSNNNNVNNKLSSNTARQYYYNDLVNNSNYNNNDNPNVQLEDFITLFQRSGDFPNKNSYLNKKKDILDENRFERERRLLNSYNNVN